MDLWKTRFGIVLLFYRHTTCNYDENRYSVIIVSLSVVLLILVVDERQDGHLDEIIQT